MPLCHFWSPLFLRRKLMLVMRKRMQSRRRLTWNQLLDSRFGRLDGSSKKPWPTKTAHYSPNQPGTRIIIIIFHTVLLCPEHVLGFKNCSWLVGRESKNAVLRDAILYCLRLS